MDPLQTSALNALAPFLALATAATSPRAASDLISQATSASNTYVFAELLQAPNIQSLRNAEPQHGRWLKVLEIFAWGNWAEYQSTPDLPTLNDAQALKLRLLSLLTLARSPSNLTYPALQSAVSLPTSSSLEQLLTTAIYAGLVTAKLNPRQQRVDVASVAPLRDLAPNSVPQLAGILALWEQRCGDVLAGIEGRIAGVKEAAAERARGEAEWENKYLYVLAEAERKSGKREGEVLEAGGEGKKTGRFVGAAGLGIGGR
ncbi:MAG: hypothetical protein MMC23_003394 [Stictis urceolatum]|nr:hypothetical protein [Stictis urceolata]